MVQRFTEVAPSGARGCAEHSASVHRVWLKERLGPATQAEVHLLEFTPGSPAILAAEKAKMDLEPGALRRGPLALAVFSSRHCTSGRRWRHGRHADLIAGDCDALTVTVWGFVQRDPVKQAAGRALG